MNEHEINAALAACSGTYALPIGRHVVNGQITVPQGKRLLGLGQVPQTWPFLPTGAFLDVRWGAGTPGNLATAAVVLQAGATIENVCGDYSTVQPATREPTEWASFVMPFDPASGGLCMSVIGCNFNRAWIGADFRGSRTGQGIIGPIITGNYGTPLNTGIWLDYMVDWGVIKENRFNSGFIDPVNPSNPLRRWVSSYGTVVKLGGNDWATVENAQAWGYKCGVEIKGGDGYSGVGPYRVRGCSFDSCLYGVYINPTAEYKLIALEGNNFCPYNSLTGAGGYALALPATTGKGIIFQGNYIFGPAAGIVQAPNSSWSLFTVLNNQGDAGTTGVPWLDKAGASTYFNVAYNRFGGFL